MLLLVFSLPPLPARANLAAADLDGDGAITLADLKRMSQELNTLAAAYRGDANGDGKVDATDLRHVARALVRAVAPGANLDDEATDRFVKFAVADAAPGQVPPGLAPQEAERFRDLVTKLGVNPQSRTAESLEPAAPEDPGAPPDEAETPSDPASAPDPATAAPEGPGDDELGDTTLLPPAPGGRPTFTPGLRRFASIFTEVLKDADINFNIRQINEARTALLPEGFATRSIAECFAAFEETQAEGLPLSDCPDPTAFRSGETTSGLERMSIGESRSGADGRRELLPRGRYALRFNPADPEAMRLDTRGRDGAVTLADEYEEVSPQDPLPDSPILEAEVRERSDDPWIGQMMRDLRDAREFMKKADANGNGRVSRIEALGRLFSPEVAREIAAGNAGAVGLAPGSPLVENYARAVEQLTPALIQSGVLSRATARTVRRTVAGMPGGIGSLVGIGGEVDGAAAPEAVPGYVHVSSRLNVRSGPTTGNAIVGRLPDGARVMILKQVGDWYKIRFTPYAEQGYAYVHSDYVSSSLGAASGGTYTGGSSGGSSGGSTVASAPVAEDSGAEVAGAATKSLAGLSTKMKAAVTAGAKVGASVGKASTGVLGAVKGAVKNVASTVTKSVKSISKWLF